MIIYFASFQFFFIFLFFWVRVLLLYWIESLGAPRGSPGGTFYALCTVILTKSVVCTDFIAKIVAQLQTCQKVVPVFVSLGPCAAAIVNRHYICARDTSRTLKKSAQNKFWTTKFSEITNPSNQDSQKSHTFAIWEEQKYCSCYIAKYHKNCVFWYMGASYSLVLL